MRSAVGVESVRLDVTNNADDGCPGSARGTANQLDVLADGVTLGPIAAGEGFNYERDLLSLGIVVIAEDASFEKRGFQHVEVAGTYRGKFRHWGALRFGDVILDGEGKLSAGGVHRKAVGTSDGRCFHAGEGTNAAENLAQKLSALLDDSIGILGGIVRERQPNLCSKNAMRVESRTHLGQMRKAAQQQSCADEQNQRQGDFGGHQEA